MHYRVKVSLHTETDDILVQAPCEAEATCAALVKAGKVFATATEDMDGLTFGTSVLLRHLTASEAKYVYKLLQQHHMYCIRHKSHCSHHV